MSIKNNYYFLFLLILLSSCDIINPEEQIPSYITIAPIEFTADNDTQGSASSKITEGWLFVDGEFIGAYSLPATVPVLFSGERTVRVQAGIKDNGINETAEIYPFYETAEFQVTLTPTETVTVEPKISYLAEAEFAFIEDFESSDHIFQDDRDGNPATTIEITSSDVFEGNRSGKITLTPNNPQIQVATDANSLFSDLQKDQVFVYVEVNYKSDVPVLWGVIGYNDGIFSDAVEVYDPGFNAKDEWNKIYFNFSQILFNENFAALQFALTANLPSENGAFVTEEAEILLDNIKVLHF